MEELYTVITIGASAGAMEPLCQIIRELPADLPAVVLVTVHVGSGSQLAEVLRRCGSIPVHAPQQEESIQPGRIYVAPPDRHMTVGGGRIVLCKSARENRHRPSIDVLFRSAARCYRARAIGVILSGLLDDGVAGLFSIKARGGTAIVQDPKEAAMPDMPQHAINYGVVDHCLPVAEIAPLLIKLSKARRKYPAPLESEIPDLTAESGSLDLASAPRPLPFSCPECSGPLFEQNEDGAVHIRCVVGHSFSPASLTQAQTEALERALWIAARSLADRKKIYQYAAVRAGQDSQPETKARLEEGIKSAEHDLAIIREIIERI